MSATNWEIEETREDINDLKHDLSDLKYDKHLLTQEVDYLKKLVGLMLVGKTITLKNNEYTWMIVDAKDEELHVMMENNEKVRKDIELSDIQEIYNV